MTGSCTAATKTEGIYQKWVEKVADREVFISSTLRSGKFPLFALVPHVVGILSPLLLTTRRGPLQFNLQPASTFSALLFWWFELGSQLRRGFNVHHLRCFPILLHSALQNEYMSRVRRFCHYLLSLLSGLLVLYTSASTIFRYSVLLPLIRPTHNIHAFSLPFVIISKQAAFLKAN